jgi:hypothetical protein
MLEIVQKIMIGLSLLTDMALILPYGIYLVEDMDKSIASIMRRFLN